MWFDRAGFTLIELLIVVTIIGILAAVAIPQLSLYRQRGYNTTAHADGRNIATAQEAHYFGAQSYLEIPLQSGPGEVGSSGLGSGTLLPSTKLSNHVSVHVATSGFGVTGSFFTLGVSHRQGGRICYLESDEGNWKYRHKAPGAAQVMADVTVATSQIDIAPDGVL